MASGFLFASTGGARLNAFVADTVQTDTCGRSWPWLGTFLIALPFLYVLSIGPVAAVFGKSNNVSPAFLESFYAPVIWLHSHTPLKRPLESYVEMWGVK